MSRMRPREASDNFLFPVKKGFKRFNLRQQRLNSWRSRLSGRGIFLNLQRQLKVMILRSSFNRVVRLISRQLPKRREPSQHRPVQRNWSNLLFSRRDEYLAREIQSLVRELQIQLRGLPQTSESLLASWGDIPASDRQKELLAGLQEVEAQSVAARPHSSEEICLLIEEFSYRSVPEDF